VVEVALDGKELEKQFTESGLQVAMPREGTWALWLRREDGAVAAVSRTLLDRVFYEFQSLSWFVRMNVRMTEKMDSSGEGIVPPGTPLMIGPEDVGPISDLPEWVRATLRGA
jgi:hypothetical protein